MVKSPTPPRTYVRRIGRHHFAHLRAVAQGIPIFDSALRYLGVEHGNAARAAHLQTREAVRALARRQQDSAWRLIGVHIHIAEAANVPTLEDFMGERDLFDWSETEVIELYREAYPQDRKTARRFRLQERQLALIYRLEGQSAETPKPQDMVSDWFDERIAGKLISAGILNLGDLSAKLATGGRWFRALPGVGAAKAQRIAEHLSTLLPMPDAPVRPLFAIKGLGAGQGPGLASGVGAGLEVLTLLSTGGAVSTLLDVADDRGAVEAWIVARAGSELTATAYRREALRLLLWLRHAQGGKTLARMTVPDCGDYLAFLQNIPAQWISRSRAAPGQPGWAPFRGPLSHRSRAQSVVIVAALFRWLQSAQYLNANPWVLVNQKTGDDAGRRMLDTKALSETAMDQVLLYIERQAPSPSRDRILFIVRFCESVGLRSAELLNARLQDLRLEPEGWVLQVQGKGSKNRLAAVPGQAFSALQAYLVARGLGGVEVAPADAPLLASTLDPLKSVGYQALYEHVRSWLAKAVANSALPSHERQRLAGASTHWLRHTFGTRAIAREVPLDVIQAQMGHASIQTTTAIYGRAPLKRRVSELGKAFG